MTKTWETLFHLANFMKYLLYDVLPKEQNPSPQYVMDSLMDLLQTTLECIHNVRDRNRNGQVAISQLKEHFYGLIESDAGKTILQTQRGKSALSTLKLEKQNHTNLQFHEETNFYSKKNNEYNETVLPIEEKPVASNSISGRSETQPLDESFQNHEVIGKNTEKEEPYRAASKESHIEMDKIVDHKASDTTLLFKGETNIKKVNKKNKKKALACSHMPKQIENEQSIGISAMDLEKSRTNIVADKEINKKQQEQFVNKKMDQQEQCGLLMNEEIDLRSLKNCDNHSQGFLKDKETLQKISLGSGIVTRHKSIIINKNFVFLNEQVISGLETYGAFCLPCDKGFFFASDWNSHLNDDWKHSEMSCEEVSCEKCDFFICGNSIILGVYLDFHAKSHNPESAKDEVSNNSISESSNFPIIQPQPKIDEVFPKDLFISSRFVEVHTKLINNALNEGYYCGICDNFFFSNKKWLQHLQDYHQREDLEKNTNQCNICPMVIFSTLELSKNLFSYHIKAHESENSLVSLQDHSKSSDMASHLSRTSSNLELDPQLKTSDMKYKKPKAKQNNSKEVIISDNFIQLNKKVHNRNVTGAYYCRPCDKVHYSTKDWEVHCVSQRHTTFMQNKKFQNSLAVCTICNMTMIGSKRIVKEYMKYHSTGHDEVPSYELKLISIEAGSQAKPANDSNNEGSHIEKSFEDNSYSTSKTELNVSLNDIHHEKDTLSCEDESWFHQDLISRIKSLFLDRKKKKLSGKSLTFHAFCLVCECEMEDAFEWMDHLELNLHRSKMRENDEELIYREYNINIFGNKSLIVKDLPC